MKIQILHGRDPDGACDTQVYVDGKLIQWMGATAADFELEVEDVDPGRGWERADWNTRVRDALAAHLADPANEFLEHSYLWLKEASDSPYITGDNKPEPSSWTFCGHWSGGELIIDYVLPGEQDDRRESKGKDLWAAAATGRTQDIAQAVAIGQHQEAGHEHDPGEQPGEALSHLRHDHGYRYWVDIAPDDAAAIHRALHAEDPGT